MMGGDVIAAIATSIAATLAGVFGYLAKKTHNRAPETIAGGYSKLIGDMQIELARLREQMIFNAEERTKMQKRLNCLDKQIFWLLANSENTLRDEFTEMFKKDSG